LWRGRPRFSCRLLAAEERSVTRIFAPRASSGDGTSPGLDARFRVRARPGVRLRTSDKRAAPCCHSERQLIKASQAERVSVGIFESREDSTPLRFVWRRRETHPAAAPFFVFGLDILGDEVNARVSANELRHRIRHSLRECDVCGAVRGSDFNPADARDVLIHNQAETELVQIEAQASLLIANEDHDEMERDVGVSLVQTERKAVHPKRQWRILGVSHSRDYTSEAHSEIRLLNASQRKRRLENALAIFHAYPVFNKSAFRRMTG